MTATVSSSSVAMLLAFIPVAAQAYPFFHTPNSNPQCRPDQLQWIDDSILLSTEKAEAVSEPLSMSKPEFMVAYIVFAAFATLFAVYYIGRVLSSVASSWDKSSTMTSVATAADPAGPADPAPSNSPASKLRADSAGNAVDRAGEQVGFRDTFAGSCLYFLVVFMTLLLNCVLLVMCLDFYRLLSPTRIFVSVKHLYYWFPVVWHTTVVWLVVLKFAGPRLRNFFRSRVPLSQATYVQFWTPHDAVEMLQKPSAAVRLSMKMDEFARKYLGMNGRYETIPVQTTAKGQRFIEYRCLRHAFSDYSGRFEVSWIELPAHGAALVQQSGKMTSVEAADRIVQVGPNFIDVPCSTVLEAIWAEVASFFYIYQVMMLWVWFMFDYWRMTASIGLVISASLAIKVYTTVVAERRVKQMAAHRASADVFRDGKWSTICTSKLVPGDLIGIYSKNVVPCDCVVVHGTVIVDESMLTGESRPVRKFAVDQSPGVAFSRGPGKNTLSAGTKVLQTEADASSVCPSGQKHQFAATAVVVATGGNTFKGEMLRSILYPEPMSFTFDSELTVVICILALHGAVFAVLNFVCTGGGDSAWFYAMCAMVTSLSPMLPAMLVVGQTIAARRLAAQNVNCVQVRRVTLAGKVSVACFDKTGTLTRQGLEFAGVQAVKKHRGRFHLGKPHTKASSAPDLLQIALATAHSVSMLDGEQVGNPVDVEMFGSSGWTIVDKVNGNVVVESPEKRRVHVLRSFAFDHNLMRMSVIVREEGSAVVHVLCKGSFESIKKLAGKESIPENFDSVTMDHARNGTYTLGVGHRTLTEDEAANLTTLARADVERSLQAIGLLMFRNTLKQDSALAVSELRQAGIRPVMITGDNALTGICIAREVGMLAKKHSPVYLADLNANGDLVWSDAMTGDSADVDGLISQSIQSMCSSQMSRSMGSGSGNNDSVCSPSTESQSRAASRSTGRSLSNRDDDNASEAADSDDDDDDDDSVDSAPEYLRIHLNFELAMTGRAFRALKDSPEMRQYLLVTRVFARMSPEDKVDCVRLHMEAGSIVAMVGDGGNDCGALRASHVGLALSDSDASIVSPFSSTTGSVMSFVELIRQGRGALATSFASFKFIVVYGQILGMMKLLSGYYSVVMSENTWVFLDSIMFVVLSWALTFAGPAKGLTHRRPTARLLGPETVLSVVFLLLVNIMFIVICLAWMYSKAWYQCHEWPSHDIDMTSWTSLADNFEASLFTFITFFQVIATAAVFNLGGEFRAMWSRNRTFVALLCVLTVTVAYMLLGGPSMLSCYFRVNCSNDYWANTLGWPQDAVFVLNNGNAIEAFTDRLALLGLLVANGFVMWIVQYFGVLGPIRRRLRKKFPLPKLEIPL